MPIPLRHIAAVALLASASAQAASSIVVNGSLSGSVGRDAVPSGWTKLAGSPDIMDANDNVGMAGYKYFGATPNASPDGGTWVGLGADTNYVEQFGQQLKGLTVGQTYTVTWVDGNFGYSNGSIAYLGQNAIDVQIDGASIGKGATLSIGSNWMNESLTFTATAAAQQISFKLATSEKAYLSIDGIAVNAGGAAPVPEPAGASLLVLGLVGMAGHIRRRRAAHD